MSNPRLSKKTKVILGGGLGNQLFQYAAGLYVSKKHDSQLLLDATFSQHGRTGHEDWLNVLDLPVILTKDTPRRSISYLMALIRRFSRGLLFRLAKQRSVQVRILRQFRSQVVGFDPDLDEAKPPVTLFGYFQTWRYVQHLQERGEFPNLQLKKPSGWFRATEQQLMSQGRVLGIHLRRGDYLKNPKIGTLSAAYYAKALNFLNSRGIQWNAIWVFSDDVETAKSELGKVFSEKDRVIYLEPPPDSHSFESISLMAKTTALIIANSTFSWWAAFLGDPQRPIVCPDKWFADLPDPLDLLPEDWIRIKADWASPHNKSDTGNT